MLPPRPGMLLRTAPPWDSWLSLLLLSPQTRCGASAIIQSQEATVAHTSKKDEALQAALGIIERDGIPALTYESLADATGRSKSGLIYHFPSRHDMLIDIQAWSAQRWAEELSAIAGAHVDELDRKQHLPAYI